MGMTNNNLCDSCINIGCMFQSGIVRTECAFYMPPHIEPDNCGNYVVMQPTINDNVKQKLLDSLAEEPTMVLSTAYAYAKNYVNYGEDITKAWTTAVQQASILDYVRQKARAEAYDSFKKEYEARLKADMVAMLKELKKSIEDKVYNVSAYSECLDCDVIDYEDVNEIIIEKINSLKESEDDKI